MRDNEVIADVDQDLQQSTRARVVYLEGASDPDIFFALLGVAPPPSVGPGRFVHQGILVRGLPADRGSGAAAVRRRVALAGQHQRRHIYGFIDGDGDPYELLGRGFDAPFAGPLFRWKAYAIENLLVRAGWPAHWGREPAWPRVFRQYAPYVALNRLHRRILDDLAAVGLADYQAPRLGVPPRKNREVIRQLKEQAHLLPKRDVLLTYRREVAEFLEGALDEQHARLNGKWLVEVLAPTVAGRSPEVCRSEWIGEVIARGGSPDVRALWERAIRSSS